MATIASIYRYPVKGLSPEPLQSVTLAPGQTIPFDRAYAIENGPSPFDPKAPMTIKKAFFLMLMKNERLAELKTRFDARDHTLTIAKDGVTVAAGRLDTPEGRTAIETYFNRTFAAELRGPARILFAAGHSFSDTAAKAVSLINLATVREIGERIGVQQPETGRAGGLVSGQSQPEIGREGGLVSGQSQPEIGRAGGLVSGQSQPEIGREGGLVSGQSQPEIGRAGGLVSGQSQPEIGREGGLVSGQSQPEIGREGGLVSGQSGLNPLRFRGNLTVEGLPAWGEFGWVGKKIAAGGVTFETLGRIDRCAATNVDPDTGARDLRIPDSLREAYGHIDCGIYLRAVTGGTMATGDPIMPV